MNQLVTECTETDQFESRQLAATDTYDPVAIDTKRSNVNSQALGVVDDRNRKDFMTEAEIEKFLTAARRGRHGVRNFAMMLLAYRHGLRVSELIGLRMNDVDLQSARLFVRRLKGSLSTQQPLAGDELRAIKAWLRIRSLDQDATHQPNLFVSERGPFVREAVNRMCAVIGKRAKLAFPVNPHMLRHSCGYYLANKGHDTRLVADYLGHRNLQHTMRYTRTCASRFEDLWTGGMK